NPSGVGGKDPDLGTPQTRGKEFQVFSEAGAPQFATISWVQPFDPTPDTTAHRKKNLIENIALTILNQRLAAVAQRDDAPFTSAGASHGNSGRSAKIASLRVASPGDKWQRAFEEAEKIRRQVVAQGATQRELDREISAILSDADASLPSSKTRQSRNLAQGL